MFKLGQNPLARRPARWDVARGMDRQFIHPENGVCEKKPEKRDVTEDNETILTPPVSTSIPSSSSVFQGGDALYHLARTQKCPRQDRRNSQKERPDSTDKSSPVSSGSSFPRVRLFSRLMGRISS